MAFDTFEISKKKVSAVVKSTENKLVDNIWQFCSVVPETFTSEFRGLSKMVLQTIQTGYPGHARAGFPEGLSPTLSDFRIQGLPEK
jgi:hypothetical protein